MFTPSIDKLVLTRTGANTYDISGVCNNNATIIENPVAVHVPDDRAVSFVVLDQTKKIEFAISGITFDSGYKSPDVLQLVFNGTRKGAVTIRDTNYPPPYKELKDISQKALSGSFTITRLECTRAGGDNFDVRVTADYTSLDTRYTVNSASLQSDNVHGIPALVLFVNKALVGSPQSGSLVHTASNLVLKDHELLNLPVVISDDTPGSVTWSDIIQKKILFHIK